MFKIFHAETADIRRKKNYFLYFCDVCETNKISKEERSIGKIVLVSYNSLEIIYEKFVVICVEKISRRNRRYTQKKTISFISVMSA